MTGTRPFRGRCGCRAPTRGQSLVEFALVLPVFVLLVMGLFDLGRLVYAQHTLTEGGREASRVGQVSPAYSPAKYEAIRDAALAHAPGVTLVGEDISGLVGTSCSGVPVTPVPPDDGVPLVQPSCFYPDGIERGKRVVVNISVTLQLFTPIISQIVGDSITISTQSVSYIQ